MKISTCRCFPIHWGSWSINWNARSLMIIGASVEIVAAERGQPFTDVGEEEGQTLVSKEHRNVWLRNLCLSMIFTHANNRKMHNLPQNYKTFVLFFLLTIYDMTNEISNNYFSGCSRRPKIIETPPWTPKSRSRKFRECK